MRYFHGSNEELPVGTMLSPRGAAYAHDWGGTDFYSVLERYRPNGMRAHADAVFLVSDPDDIDLAGGGTEWIFEVDPIGDITRHDLNWSSEISCLLSEGLPVDSEAVCRAALSYWGGVPHANESVWEYLCDQARILTCEPFESFGMEP